MDKPSITGSAVDEYRKLCDGKRALIFCCSIEHSKHVAEQFRQAGYQAVHIDGNTDESVRDMAIADFERGAIQILSNVDICGEGLSIDAIECIILLRPTQSLGLYIQTVGRGLRTYPGKEMLTILDHVGSTLKFGFIDEPRDWQLTYDEETRTKKKPEIQARVCLKCYAASPVRARVCANCGAPFPVEAREVEQRKGELQELTPEELAKRRESIASRREVGMTDSLQALIEIGKRRGYDEGWALHVWNAKQAKAGSDAK
jgi:superfamily II DNA or RNA helicase